MKLEQFLRAGIVASALLFVVIVLIYGNAQWSITYNFTTPSSFNTINNTATSNFDTLSVVHSRYENNTLLRYTRPGQSEQDDPTTDDTNFYEYQARSFKATGEAVASSRDWFGAISDVGGYLMVPGVFLVTIITLLVISIAFALITFWRGRRP